MQDQEFQSNPVIETLQNHVTIREYIDKPIDENLLKTLLNAARRSPTSSNMQAYSLVVVREQDKKDKLAELSNNSHVSTCGAVITICADINRLDQANSIHGESLARNLENFLVSSVDAALVGMSLSTAAESVGLGTCMLGGMRNNPKKISELLGFPDGVYVVYGLAIGWPDWDRVRDQKPRLPEDLVIHWEEYDNTDPTEQLKAHDKELRDHYEAQGRNAHEAAWTGMMARKFSSPRRPFLRSTLEEMGFQFD